MARRDDMLAIDEERMLPMPSIRPEDRDPQDMQDLFTPPRDQKPMPPPMKVRQASMDLPVRNDVSKISDSTSPDVPERAPGMDVAPGLVSPDDSRYGDPQNLIVGDILTGGMLPWIQATADVAAGRVDQSKFDDARQEHQRRLEELKGEHPDFVDAATKAMPFVTGLIGGGVGGAAGKAAGVAAGAAHGAAQGYSAGPVEEPSSSGTRTGQAVGGAAIGGAVGAAGAAVPAAVQGTKSLIGKTTSMLAERTAAKAADAATKLKAEKKAASTAKGAATRQAKKQAKEMDARYEKRIAQENEALGADYERYTATPTSPSKHWEKNRKIFAQDPIHAFNEAAKNGMGIEGMSRALNLPPAAIIQRIAGRNMTLQTPGQESLFKEGVKVSEVLKQYKQRGLDVRGSTTGPAGGTSAAPASGAATEPAAGGSTATTAAKRSGKSKSDAADKPKSKPATKPRAPRKPKPKPSGY